MSAANNVYVFKSDHGLVKIGKSKNPEKRLKGIQAASGLIIDLAHVREIENASVVERAAHILLWDKRRNGEWFDVSVEDAIKAIDRAIHELAKIEPKPPSLPIEPISKKQCRMARAALEWDMKHLAKAAVISTNTVARFERGRNEPNPVTLKAIRLAFEAAGMLFIDADETAAEGVRLKTAMQVSADADS